MKRLWRETGDRAGHLEGNKTCNRSGLRKKSIKRQQQRKGNPRGGDRTQIGSHKRCRGRRQKRVGTKRSGAKEDGHLASKKRNESAKIKGGENELGEVRSRGIVSGRGNPIGRSREIRQDADRFL